MFISIDQKLASPAGGGAAYSKQGLSTMVHVLHSSWRRHNQVFDTEWIYMKLGMILTLVVWPLIGCNGFKMSTNIGDYATNTAKSYTVYEYSKAEILRFNADALGLVEADYCQPKLGDPKPSEAAIKGEMKVKARNKGGNGLVVEQCVTDAQPMCAAYLTCWGMAYNVPVNQARP